MKSLISAPISLQMLDTKQMELTFLWWYSQQASPSEINWPDYQICILLWFDYKLRIRPVIVIYLYANFIIAILFLFFASIINFCYFAGSHAIKSGHFAALIAVVLSGLVISVVYAIYTEQLKESDDIDLLSEGKWYDWIAPSCNSYFIRHRNNRIWFI